MRKDNTSEEAVPALLTALLALVVAHRPAFRREQPYRRAVALVFGEVFAFARHTVTQGLLALGLTDADWSAFYRLFSRCRYDEERLSRCFFRETLLHSKSEEPYVTGIDTTQIPRSSMKMPGTGWLRAPHRAVFRRGIHRAQRFLNGAWLPAIQDGYTRAMPLRFLPAFPEKAVKANVAPLKEWAAGLKFMHWVRQELDSAGRWAQLLLVLGDGAHDIVELWRGLPQRTAAVIRTAKNRRLRELPPPYSGHGPHRKYGAVAPAPATWLKPRKGFQKTLVQVPGRTLQMRYRVCGLCAGASCRAAAVPDRRRRCHLESRQARASAPAIPRTRILPGLGRPAGRGLASATASRADPGLALATLGVGGCAP